MLLVLQDLLDLLESVDLGVKSAQMVHEDLPAEGEAPDRKDLSARQEPEARTVNKVIRVTPAMEACLVCLDQRGHSVNLDVRDHVVHQAARDLMAPEVSPVQMESKDLRDHRVLPVHEVPPVKTAVGAHLVILDSRDLQVHQVRTCTKALSPAGSREVQRDPILTLPMLLKRHVTP